jgi:hypothetical protein
VTDAAALAAFWGALGGRRCRRVVFRADLEEAAVTTVEGEELIVDAWRAGEPPRQVRRR